MIEIGNNNGICTVFVSGRIDSSNAPDFKNEIDSIDDGGKLILDIKNLEYISSAGLRVILGLRKKHEDLEVINASVDVYDIFDMTGFTEMMKVSKAYREVSVEGCEVIGQGANGKVYRIDNDTVVKVYLNPDCLADIEHERDVARKALVLGIPTAISYDIVKVGDNFASMFEMINAQSFSQLLASHPENIDEYVKLNVDLLKLIHSTEVPDGQLPDQREVTVNWVKFLEPHLPVDIYKKLYAMVEAIPFDNHMIHGDYHTKNLMMTNDEVILIDMDTLAVGHPILELASMYNAYRGFAILDHSVTKSFLGFDYEIAGEFWNKSLALYCGTDDREILTKKENQAKIVGYIRLLRRTIRRNGDEKLIAKYKEELIKLAVEVDSLL